jgi:membrane protein YqaA with SNARE-associated domain
LAKVVRPGESALAVLWGFAEATLFFVVPDVLFTRTLLSSLRRGWAGFALAIAGAVVAGAVMYTWAASSPAEARKAVASVPFLGEKIITPTEQRWNEEGTLILFSNPLGGVPYKVPAILAPAHLSLPEFLLISVPLRAERMMLSMIVFVPLSIWARAGDERRRRLAYWIHAGFWVVVYAVYWSINYA